MPVDAGHRGDSTPRRRRRSQIPKSCERLRGTAFLSVDAASNDCDRDGPAGCWLRRHHRRRGSARGGLRRVRPERRRRRRRRHVPPRGRARGWRGVPRCGSAIDERRAAGGDGGGASSSVGCLGVRLRVAPAGVGVHRPRSLAVRSLPGRLFRRAGPLLVGHRPARRVQVHLRRRPGPGLLPRANDQRDVRRSRRLHVVRRDHLRRDGGVPDPQHFPAGRHDEPGDLRAAHLRRVLRDE